MSEKRVVKKNIKRSHKESGIIAVPPHLSKECKILPQKDREDFSEQNKAFMKAKHAADKRERERRLKYTRDYVNSIVMPNEEVKLVSTQDSKPSTEYIEDLSAPYDPGEPLEPIKWSPEPKKLDYTEKVLDMEMN